MSKRHKQLKRERYYRQLIQCQHVDHETGVRCTQQGLECYLGYGDEATVEYFCTDHINRAGYCISCRGFFAGIEDFDFNPNGLCHECQAEWDSEFEQSEGEDGEDLF